MTATTLLEPSFADLIAAVEQAPELSEQRRRHWVCSLRQIAKWLDRPAEVIPARWHAVRLSVGQLHHARVGVTAKTLANHKSNVRAALRWFGKEHDVPQQGCACRLSGRDSATASISAYGTGSTVSCATARPAASARRRSTTRSSMSIGATATETTALRIEQYRPALHGAGVECLCELQSMAGRCSGSPSRP